MLIADLIGSTAALLARRGSRGAEMGQFSPPPPRPFSEPLLFFFFFSYPSNIDLKHLNQPLVLLHYYKNSAPPPPFQNPGSAPAT